MISELCADLQMKHWAVYSQSQKNSKQDFLEI